MESVIKDYIEENLELLKGKLYPVFTTDLSELSVAYKFTPISGGHLKQSQLELRIIDQKYDACKQVEEKILRLLDMEEDEQFVNYKGIRFRSQISGGGILFNEGCRRFEDTMYFIIDWRKKDVI